MGKYIKINIKDKKANLYLQGDHYHVNTISI